MNPSIRQVLVHLDASPHCRRRVVLSLDVARQHGAALAAAYWSGPMGGPLPYGVGVDPTYIAELMAVERQRRDTARAVFDAACAGSDVPSRWLGERGLVHASGFLQQALYADLLVLGQHDPNESGGTSPDSDFVPTVVLSSGKPALVLPYAGNWPHWGRTVVIAWKECREAARAVAAALPILKAAGKVHVLTWQRTDAEQPQRVGEPTLDLRSWLTAHGVSAQWHLEPGEPDDMGELLLSRAFDFQADLLVMGLYGHSRAREWMLGGTSRTILESMTMPVLMAH